MAAVGAIIAARAGTIADVASAKAQSNNQQPPAHAGGFFHPCPYPCPWAATGTGTASRTVAGSRVRDSGGIQRPEQRPKPHQDPRKTPPHRGAGFDIVPDRPPGFAALIAQCRYRAPPGTAMRSALPATRQAAGVPSAWSQPFQSTHERPRRWCDTGPRGRISVTAAQKAGAEGSVPEQRQDQRQGQGQGPHPWTIEPNRIDTPPSPAGRRRYKHRSALRSARVSRAMEPTRIGTPGIPRPIGVPGPALCRYPDPARLPLPHNAVPGSLGRARSRSAVPATRQAAVVPSAWSQPHQSTHERPRRWCDAGPRGRISVTAAQKAGVHELPHLGKNLLDFMPHFGENE